MALASTTGTQVFIGPVNSTAATSTQYAALAYVEIGLVETIGEFADSASTITFTSLGDARVRKRKGVRDAGDLTLTCANDPLDAGQKAAIAAQTTESTYAFKISLQDGADANDTDSVFYFRALVGSARLNVGGANAIIRRSFALLIDTPVLEIPSLVVP